MMLVNETAVGGQRAWSLLEKLGEGDAGEVYRVESMLERRPAILKRPRRSGFASDAVRQSQQIEAEGRALALLARVSDAPARVSGALGRAAAAASQVAAAVEGVTEATETGPRAMEGVSPAEEAGISPADSGAAVEVGPAVPGPITPAAALRVPAVTVGVPKLLDSAKPGAEFSDRFFIVMTAAEGLNLAYLARAARFSSESPTLPADPKPEDLHPHLRQFVEHIGRSGRLPDLLLLRLFAGLLDFFETIHSLQAETAGGTVFGVLWNDVKPDHIFWDPDRGRFTLIDWGNARFLEADGATKDRLHSRMNDYLQFVDEMGAFLEAANPELHARLDWPRSIPPAGVYTEAVRPLRARIDVELNRLAADLQEARLEESALLLDAQPDLERFERLADIRRRILDAGELPDFPNAERYFFQLGRRLVSDGELAAAAALFCRADEVPFVDPGVCRLLDGMARAGGLGRLPEDVLLAALAGDWETALWELRRAALRDPERVRWQDWYDDLRLRLDLGDLPRPFVALNRLVHALSAAVQSAEAQGSTAPSPAVRSSAGQSAAVQNTAAQNAAARGAEDQAAAAGEAADRNAENQVASAVTEAAQSPGTRNIAAQNTVVSEAEVMVGLLRRVRDELRPRWEQAEPDPPHSGIDYHEVELQLDDLLAYLPEAADLLRRALEQARLQAGATLDAWERRDFDAARRGLRRLLPWDPDRGRLFAADRALVTAPDFLDELSRGPDIDEPLRDFILRMEERARDLRNQVGPAEWLDELLQAFKELRKGGEPTDVLVDHPAVRDELSWLGALEPRRPLLASPERVPPLERGGEPPAARPLLVGARESPLGPAALDAAGGIALADPLDTWIPEARGSSARLFVGLAGGPDGPRRVAMKLMRPDRVDYALPLFNEEARILTLLQDVPGVVPLLECGFIQLDSELPPEDRHATAAGLTGRVQRFGPDSVHNFLSDLENRATRGWIPYLALQEMQRADNLLLLCDTGHTGGRFMPMLEGLAVAWQICSILEVAHGRDIVYRDHKILHYYWQSDYNAIQTIDWNVARRHPEGLSAGEIQFDLVQFAARALHVILTGRQAAGALPMGPNRPEEIEAAAHAYTAQWNYDDQHLPKDIKDLLEAALAGGYASARELRDAIQAIYQKLSELI